MNSEATRSETLYMAMELSNTKWKLAFTTGTQNPREVNIPAQDTEAIKRAIARTKEKFGLPADAPVKSCYETGRDGFWLHRFLASLGVENVVVDAASIETPRKGRTPKTDRLDAQKLLNCLMRHWRGEKRVWGIARAPTVEEEDARRVHRERDRLRKEKTAHLARIKGLLRLIGIAVRWVPEWKDRLHLLKTWDGKPIPEALRREIEREYERLELLGLQIEALKDQMAEQLDEPQTAAEHKANVTDPQSRIMKTRTGYVQGYNAQAVVTEEQIVVAAEVTPEENDVKQLHPMAQEAERNLKQVGSQEQIQVVLADAGYWSAQNLQGAWVGCPELLIATTKDWKQRKAMRERPPLRGRIPMDLFLKDRMERKLLTKRGRALYKRRSQMSEPVFGQVKDIRGCDRFMQRGYASVRAEWKLIYAGHNLLKLWRSGRWGRRCTRRGQVTYN